LFPFLIAFAKDDFRFRAGQLDLGLIFTMIASVWKLIDGAMNLR